MTATFKLEEQRKIKPGVIECDCLAASHVASHMKNDDSPAYLDKVKNIEAMDYSFHTRYEQRLQFVVRNVAVEMSRSFHGSRRKKNDPTKSESFVTMMYCSLIESSLMIRSEVRFAFGRSRV